MTALQDLSALLVNLPGYDLLTDSMKQSALDGALIPDTDAVWPGQDGYVTTYDIYFAAINLLGFLQAQPVVRQTSSEGTSVAIDAPNWAGLRNWYCQQSVIIQAMGNQGLGFIEIPYDPHVRHVDMSGRGSSDDNVDTDLA